MKITKNKLPIIITLALASLLIFSTLKNKLFTNKVAKKVSICSQMNWAQLKDKIIQHKSNNDEIYALNSLGFQCRFYYKTKSNDIDKLLQTYKVSNNIHIKRAILLFFAEVQDRDLIITNSELISTMTSIAMNGDPFLSEIAIGILFHRSSIDLEQATKIFNLRQESSLRSLMVQEISNNRNYGVDKRYAFLKSLIEGKDNSIKPLAFRQLTDLEGIHQWQSWEESDWLGKLIVKAAEGDFGLLSNLEPLAMLEITKKYPESKLTKACKEYRAIFPNDTYFGGNAVNNFRRPFFYEGEFTTHSDFIQKYPNHPASNDIIYRRARAYEIEGKYDRAIELYLESIEVGNRDTFYGAVADRIFFVANSLMNSESIDRFITFHPNHRLNPYFSYIRGIHYMRENKLNLASKDIASFIEKYQHQSTKNIQGIVYADSYYTDRRDDPYFDTYFWSEVKKQKQFLEKLQSIRGKTPSDKTLYEEAILWINYDFASYNLLELTSGASGSFIPPYWDNTNDANIYLLTYGAYKKARNNNQSDNRYIKSIESLEKLLQDYPKSELVTKAKYSIGLNYYFMEKRGYSYENINPRELMIKTFREFVEQFPDSSMADDALISIADITRDNNERMQALQQILNKYPYGDRRKDAEKMMSNSSLLGSPSTPISPDIFLGIDMNDSSDGRVVITKILFNSLASKNGLREGDSISKIMGEPVKLRTDVESKIRTYRPGDVIRIQIFRDGKPSIVEIEAP